MDSVSGAPDDSASEAARRRAERGARTALEERANRKSRPDTQAPAADAPRERGRGSAEFVLPVASYTITSRFGDSGELWSSGHHTGLDFAAAKGTPVRAVHGGTITKVTSGGPLGNHTELRLPDGTVLTFSHQATVSVKPGRNVRAGDVIGTVGATGNTTGPHLHFEVHRPDGTVIDPEKWLASEGLTA
ncbi:M23 family metallopeptidase [Streptomyces bauhiniae]